MKKLSSLILSSLLIISLGFSTTASAQSPEIQDQNAVYHKANTIEFSTIESDLPIEITPFGTDDFSEITLNNGWEGAIGPIYTIYGGTKAIFQVSIKSPNSSERYRVRLYRQSASGPNQLVYESSSTAARSKTMSYDVTTSGKYFLTVTNLSAIECTYGGYMSF